MRKRQTKQPRWCGILSFFCARSILFPPSLADSFSSIPSDRLSVREQLCLISPGRRLLVLSCVHTHAHRPTRLLVPLPPFTSQTKVGLRTQKVFCNGSVGRSVACFPYFHLFFPPSFSLIPLPCLRLGCVRRAGDVDEAERNESTKQQNASA